METKTNGAKITVISKEYHPEYESVAKDPCRCGGVCPKMSVGEVYFTGGKNLDERPEGFCEYAWNAIKKYAVTYASGGRVNLADLRVCCCNNGISPVYFVTENVNNPAAG